MMDMAETIRKAFERSGMTRNQLSVRSGVGYNAVFKFVAGKQDLTLRSASKICEVLGLKLVQASKKGKRKAKV